MSDMPHDPTGHRFAVLMWAVGITAALTVATLGMVVSLSYQIGHLAGTLDVLIGHVQMK